MAVGAESECMRSACLWLPILFLSVAVTNSGIGQARVEAHGCTVNGRDYDCDKQNFERILAVSKTISVEAPASDSYSLKQLDKLLRFLGKTLRPDSADLNLVISRPEPDGIYYGPGDRKVATLRVYYRQGKLVWVEDYFDQPNTAWPIAVSHLTDQFRKDLHR